MLNIYIKVTIDKKWCTQNFYFLSLKVRLKASFRGASTHADIIEFSNILLQLKNQRSGSKTVWLFYYFYFERNYDVLKSKSPCFLLNKNINFNKNETESKMENPTHSFREMNLCFSSYKNCELKVKLWWVGAHERKKSAFFATIFFVQRISHCIMYWINFQNIYTFTYPKISLHKLLLLVFKIFESHECILKVESIPWNDDWFIIIEHGILPPEDRWDNFIRSWGTLNFPLPLGGLARCRV